MQLSNEMLGKLRHLAARQTYDERVAPEGRRAPGEAIAERDAQTRLSREILEDLARGE